MAPKRLRAILDAATRMWQTSYPARPQPVRAAVTMVAINNEPLDTQLRRASLLLRHALRQGDWAGECEYRERIDELLDAKNLECADGC